MAPSARQLAALFAVSAAVLAFEVLLLDLFAFSHWHHFAGLAVSIALLGLGTAGTVLALAGERARGAGEVGFAVAAAFAAAGLLAVIALHAGVAVRPVIAGWDAGELAKLLVIDLVAFLPFLGAGLAIGQAFMRFPRHTPRVYAANLLGSGAGSVAASVLLATAPVERGIAVVAALLALVALGLVLGRPRARLACAAVAVVAGVTVAVPPEPAVSDFKALARLQALPDARVLATEPGLSGRLTLIRSASLRSAPGLSLRWREAVPASDAAVIGSDRVVPVARGYPVPAGYRRATLAGLGTRLRPGAEVLALGASRWPLPPDAASITRVVADERLARLARERGAPHRLVTDDPARFVHVGERRYDLVSLRGAFAGGDAAAEAPLLTVSGLERVLARLRPDGLATLPLPVAQPPRHFPRVLATLRDALRARGAQRPARHVAVVRGLQALVIVASNRPLTVADRSTITAFADRWSFDRAWLPGMPRDAANRHHRLDTPVFHDTARAVLAGGAMPAGPARFVTAPATEARPYVWRSTRWGEVDDLIGQMGPRALAYLDWTLLLGALTTVLVTALAAVLILAPLGRLPHGTRPFGRVSVAGYFLALGVGYMLLELGLFQRAIPLLGEPVLAAAVIFALFLIGSGLGSMSAPVERDRARVAAVFAPVAAGLLLAGGALWGAGTALLSPPLAGRIAALVVLVGPLAWALGRPLPWALRQLADRPRWVPWAWGINGFASVGAAAAAPLISVEYGQPVTLGVGAACYAVALAIALRWCLAAQTTAPPT